MERERDDSMAREKFNIAGKREMKVWGVWKLGRNGERNCGRAEKEGWRKGIKGRRKEKINKAEKRDELDNMSRRRCGSTGVVKPSRNESVDSVENQLTKCWTGLCIPYVLSLVFHRMYTFLNSFRTCKITIQIGINIAGMQQYLLPVGLILVHKWL